jgi:predicted phosphate transport protein (TIGR00153 family)
MFRLLPREESFFDLLEAAAVNALATARLFRDMVEDYRTLPERVQKITDAEHAGDRIIHQIMDKLNKTFVTPIDREDIHALATEIDDIVDAIEVAADRMILYRIKEPTPITISLVRVLVRCCEEVASAIPLLRSPKQMKAILSHGIEINRLENEADSLSRVALEALFADPKDALEVLKWKEVYSTLEEAIDMTENVADVLHGIVIKNA